MEKQIKIALAGNPNCGKTTLFNALTGSNQFVGNWPGVTVEKKEGKLKKHDDVVIMDLPGIYSLSPYTLEEVVARNYLIEERPDAILNIIDGTNLERNLYLTTQLTELGIPVVIAVNMMDVVRKNGDQINVKELSRQLGCEIVEISALKGDGVTEAAEAAVKAAQGKTKTIPMHTFSGPVEHAIAHIEEAAVHNLPEEQQRWFALKIFERDQKILEQLRDHQERHRQAELDSRQCLSGPHKDDLVVFIGGQPARTYASQGQVRTAALSLKLAQREIFQEETGEWPVLLLDDVLSELDGKRQSFVLNHIRGGQVFIPCCEEEKLEGLETGKSFHIQNGTLL